MSQGLPGPGEGKTEKRFPRGGGDGTRGSCFLLCFLQSDRTEHEQCSVKKRRTPRGCRGYSNKGCVCVYTAFVWSPAARAGGLQEPIPAERWQLLQGKVHPEAFRDAPSSLARHVRNLAEFGSPTLTPPPLPTSWPFVLRKGNQDCFIFDPINSFSKNPSGTC